MRPRDRALADRLVAALARYEHDVEALPGIAAPQARASLVEQLVESDRRVRFFATIAARPVNSVRAEPAAPAFDPLRAAVLHHRQDDLDEACWLVFLFVLFGKNRRSGYRLAADVYGRLGHGRWRWIDVHGNPAAFSAWIDTHVRDIRSGGGRFGNHRKYESIPAIGRVVTSYVSWVGPDHANRFVTHTANAGPEDGFEALYWSMDAVHRFGRVGRFDYLSTVGRLGLADIRPGRPYFGSATGPKTGAEILYGRTDLLTRQLEARTIELGRDYLALGFDVLEDALCNWQKSPEDFRPFRG